MSTNTVDEAVAPPAPSVTGTVGEARIEKTRPAIRPEKNRLFRAVDSNGRPLSRGANTSSDTAATSDSRPLVLTGDTVSTALTSVVEAVNATVAADMFGQVSRDVQRAFLRATALARSDDEGHERFAQSLESLLQRYGAVALEAVAHIVLLEGRDAKVGLSALRAAGHLGEQVANETRRWLAENALNSHSPEIRYGALHILADLGDRQAVSVLAQAEQREPIGALKADIARLLDSLRRA